MYGDYNNNAQSSCGLRVCDETIRVAVGLRLGLSLCEAHTCPCGALVSARGTHGVSCKRSNLGGLLVIIKSTILFGGPSNTVMFRPQKNHRGYLEMMGNASMALR